MSAVTEISTDDMDFEFSNNDTTYDYDESEAKTVADSEKTVKITAEGTYVVSGEHESITVSAPDTAKVRIILKNATVSNTSGPAIYIEKADKVFITAYKDTTNTLSDGTSYTGDFKDTNIDGTIFSKTDLTLNGEGTLNITANCKCGVVSKDDLIICGLNLTVKSNKPVVLVGAMRPSTALSADGPLNLYNAVVTAAAKESKDKGVLVAMNGLILGAQSTVKMNTVDVQTFQAPNSGALGYVLNGKVFYNQVTLKKHTTQSVFDVTHLNALPKVGIVYSYSNIEADMVTPMLNNGYKGIIHAGVGNGNIHQNIFPVLTDARQKGILVVRSSRVPTGPTTLDAEVDDAKYQFVASQELNPQKSRVLLMLALTKTTDWKQIQQYFNEY